MRVDAAWHFAGSINSLIVLTHCHSLGMGASFARETFLLASTHLNPGIQAMRESLGRAYAWRAGGQWFHASSNDIAPPDAILVERYIICGEVVLRLSPAHGGGVIRGARVCLAPTL
jgi:hypothetical protein